MSPIVCSTSERKLLHGLHQQALQYFIDNQLPNGFILDRQRNHNKRTYKGLISTSATGMGLMALALASNKDHGLLTRTAACKRVERALKATLALHDQKGMVAHFLDADTLATVGSDAISTIDASWLFAGGLWAAEYLEDDNLRDLANQLYQRIDWHYWSVEAKDLPGKRFLSHGADAKGNFLQGIWDRHNAETAFMYVLALGADSEKALPSSSLTSLGLFYDKVYDMPCVSGDLGLFVFQYSRELLDLDLITGPGGIDLSHEWEKPVLANYAASHQYQSQFKTFLRFWGISAGDGPPDEPGQNDTYKAYAPHGIVDGTAHVMATVASIGVWPQLVLANLKAVQSDQTWCKARGRYGYSNINVDRNWYSLDVVGIDVGIAAVALENAMYCGRVRDTFHKLVPVRRALERLSAVA